MSRQAYRHILQRRRPGAPLLVLLHGTGGSAADLLPLGASLLAGATLLAPEGDVREGAAVRFFRRTAEGVYDRADLARASEKLAGFVRAHAQALGASMVLGLGYSNGANLLVSTLFTHPVLFDGLVLMHPLIPFEPELHGRLDGLPILVTAGRRDPVCPPALTERLGARLEEAGASLALVWHEGGHELRNSEVAAAQSLFARFDRTDTGVHDMTDAPQGEIRLEENAGRGRYSLDLGSGTAAELTFGREQNGSMVVDHTFVPPRMRGQGVAARLVQRAVADARNSGVKVVPLCPYVAAEFRRHPEWSDLLQH